MKFLLTLIICSGVSGECLPAKGYPIITQSYAECTLEGMLEAHKFLTKNFTFEQIDRLKIIPKYTCTQVNEV